MSINSLLSDRFIRERSLGNVDMDADTFKVILMDSSFKYLPASHGTLSDVTSHQIATGNGYTQNNKTLTGVNIGTGSPSTITWNDVTWTASGGSIGPVGGMVIYDDTHANDIVMGCCDFGQDYTVPDGQDFELRDISLEVNRDPSRDTITTTTTTSSTTTTTTAP